MTKSTHIGGRLETFCDIKFELKIESQLLLVVLLITVGFHCAELQPPSFTLIRQIYGEMKSYFVYR